MVLRVGQPFFCNFVVLADELHADVAAEGFDREGFGAIGMDGVDFTAEGLGTYTVAGAVCRWNASPVNHRLLSRHAKHAGRPPHQNQHRPGGRHSPAPAP